MRRTWILGFLLLAPMANANDSGPSKEEKARAIVNDYGYALGQIHAESAVIPIIARLCENIDPSGRQEFANALAQWRERYRAVFDDVRSRLDAFDQMGSAPNPGMKEFHGEKVNQARVTLSETFQSMKASDARLACRKVSGELAKPERDPEIQFSKHLAVIRAFPESLDLALK